MMSSPLPGSTHTPSPGQAVLPTIAGAAATGCTTMPARTTLSRSPTRAIHVTFPRLVHLLLQVVGDARHRLDQGKAVRIGSTRSPPPPPGPVKPLAQGLRGGGGGGGF